MNWTNSKYTPEQGIYRGRLQRTGDQHGHDQPVDGNDTRHDHRDDGLHDELGPHHRHGSNTGPRLGSPIGCSKGWKREIIILTSFSKLYVCVVSDGCYVKR